MQSRRHFLRNSAVVAASTTLLPWHRLLADDLKPEASPYKNLVVGRKVRVAAVGCGGKGYSDLQGVNMEEIVALCDVDFERGAQLFREYPNVPRYKDFRRMLDEMHDQIDAVTISTPDHMHFPVALMAIERGKHVYVQKPLTHTIGEARALKEASLRMGVVTQMGNQGHANEGTRLVREWIEDGAIGDVLEVNAWTNRPVWPQNIPWPETNGQTAPATLDWDLWLGVAPYRAYRPGLAPFNWRGMWDYGCGALGDMGCHLLDAAFWTLDLRGPCKVTATSEGGNSVTAPKGATMRWEYPARNGRKPVVITWREGSNLQPRPEELAADQPLARGGVLYRGTKGVIYSPGDYSESPRLIPESAMAAYKRPARKYPRIPKSNPHTEWIRAIKGGPVPGSNIPDHSADLTEFTHLGNLALRLNKPIEWDAAAGRCVGLPEAAALIHKNYRVF